MLRVFISYSTDNGDKWTAGTLKTNLEDFGFKVFLAHEDIELGTNWQERIQSELESCDIFLPIISTNFKNSDWADQETGIAFELGKMIIPIKIDIDPYGFIGHIQAFKFDNDKTIDACISIIQIVSKQREYKEELITTLILGFSDSKSFDDANNKAKILKSIPELTFEQELEIIRVSMNNSQIYEGFNSQPFVRGLLKKHLDKKEIIIDSLKRNFEQFFLRVGVKETIDADYVKKEIKHKLDLDI